MAAHMNSSGPQLDAATTPGAESFVVGGQWVEIDGEHMLTGQMYVQYRPALAPRRGESLLLIPGGCQTGACFEATPDGRSGWAEHFARAGFDTYVVDPPGRGRSGYLVQPPAAMMSHGSGWIERRFTDCASAGLWRQAERHTAWPGTGRRGDAVFDRFYASQVPQVADRGWHEITTRDACAALLDRIGPATVLVHSMSGPVGWLLADARPGLVRAVVALEPEGPPFRASVEVGAPGFLAAGDVDRPFGLTLTPLCYQPPVVDPQLDLDIVVQESGDPALFAPNVLQREPARQLPNLARVPVLVITGEASYHAGYDHCTVAYLRQAGVNAVHLPLADIGISGNGHMMMLESNNADISAAVIAWLDEAVL